MCPSVGQLYADSRLNKLKRGKTVLCVFVDFQKIAANIHEFQLKLSDDVECAEVRDALNFALLQLQRYFRMLHSRTQHQQQHNDSILTQSLRGLSPMTPFRDAPDRFVWRWVEVDGNNDGRSVRTSRTLPVRLDKEAVSVPAVIRVARNSDNNSLVQLIEHGKSLWYYCVGELLSSMSDSTGNCVTLLIVNITLLLYVTDTVLMLSSISRVSFFGFVFCLFSSIF